MKICSIRKSRKKSNQGQKDSTSVKVIAFHVTDISLIPHIENDSLSMPVVTPDIEAGIDLKYCGVQFIPPIIIEKNLIIKEK